MDREEILKRVIDVTAKVLRLDSQQVKPTSNFVFDLGAESVQSIELVAAFEEEFKIEMDGEAALEVQTVDTAVSFIVEYLEKK